MLHKSPPFFFPSMYPLVDAKRTTPLKKSGTGQIEAHHLTGIESCRELALDPVIRRSHPLIPQHGPFHILIKESRNAHGVCTSQMASSNLFTKGSLI